LHGKVIKSMFIVITSIMLVVIIILAIIILVLSKKYVVVPLDYVPNRVLPRYYFILVVHRIKQGWHDIWEVLGWESKYAPNGVNYIFFWC